MNLRRFILAAALLATGIGGALADPGHHHHRFYGPSFGLYVGPPWGPWIYPPPYYYPYPPRVVVVPAQPPVYIEQPSAGGDQYWYYCQQSGAYYPQVNQCPGGWLRVEPRP